MLHQVRENFSVWEYENYTAIGVLGRVSDIGLLVLPEGEKEESIVIQQGPFRQFKAVMYFNPVMDLTIVQENASESSLFLQGFGRESI